MGQDHFMLSLGQFQFNSGSVTWGFNTVQPVPLTVNLIRQRIKQHNLVVGKGAGQPCGGSEKEIFAGAKRSEANPDRVLTPRSHSRGKYTL